MKFDYKYHIKGTLILLLIMLIVLASFAYTLINLNSYVQKIVLICYFSLWAFLIVLYWSVGLFKAYKNYKEDNKGYQIKNDK